MTTSGLSFVAGPAVAVGGGARNRPRDQYWRSLYYFNVYRIIVAASLLLVVLTRTRSDQLEAMSTTLFLVAAIALMVVGLASVGTIGLNRPAFTIQANLQIGADLVLIGLMMHAGGGAGSGLPLLLIVSVAGAGVVMPPRTTLAYAALASTIVGFEALYWALQGEPGAAGLVPSLMLVVGLFATAILVSGLASRIKVTEAIAERQAVDIVNLDQLNQTVVEQLDTGVLVLDAADRVRVANLAGRRWLGTEVSAGESIHRLNRPLASLLDSWRRDAREPEPLRLTDRGPVIAPRLLTMGDSTLIFLENTSDLRRAAQQLKLAALGRLTAAIAHEIRNPLGALSHAGQLLNESGRLDEEDRRLLGIVRSQSERLNRIVESILHLGRHSPRERLTFPMSRWFAQFRLTFCETQALPEDRLVLEGDDIEVEFDESQLEQILFNLCDNALRHGADPQGDVRIRLVARRASGNRRATLDVIDSGPGIPSETVEQIFEPFFTTSPRGTGLGLYLARELAEQNQSQLECVYGEKGAHFRLVFANP